MTATAARAHRILEAWAEETSYQIAAREGCSRGSVLSTIRRARLAGDPRAIHKPDGRRPGSPGWKFSEGCPKTAAIWRSGVVARQRKRMEVRA